MKTNIVDFAQKDDKGNITIVKGETSFSDRTLDKDGNLTINFSGARVTPYDGTIPKKGDANYDDVLGIDSIELSGTMQIDSDTLIALGVKKMLVELANTIRAMGETRKNKKGAVIHKAMSMDEIAAELNTIDIVSPDTEIDDRRILGEQYGLTTDETKAQKALIKLRKQFPNKTDEQIMAFISD